MKRQCKTAYDCISDSKLIEHHYCREEFIVKIHHSSSLVATKVNVAHTRQNATLIDIRFAVRILK